MRTPPVPSFRQMLSAEREGDRFRRPGRPDAVPSRLVLTSSQRPPAPVMISRDAPNHPPRLGITTKLPARLDAFHLLTSSPLESEIPSVTAVPKLPSASLCGFPFASHLSPVIFPSSPS
jgi:hypothetical protein